MDMRLFFRVLWRFKALVVLGIMLAFVLATLSFVRVTLDGFPPSYIYRSSETWSVQATLLVTQEGFPLGRAVPGFMAADPARGLPAVQVGDPNTLTSLALVYTQLLNSDDVRRRVFGSINRTLAGPPRTTDYSATLISDTTGGALPLVAITGVAPTPYEAANVAKRASQAFRDYLEVEQQAAKIALNERAVVQEIGSASHATLLKGRKKTGPVFIFLAIMIATCGLAFMLENLRPRANQTSPDELERRPASLPTADEQNRLSA
jgi:hypothetical protein